MAVAKSDNEIGEDWSNGETELPIDDWFADVKVDPTRPDDGPPGGRGRRGATPGPLPPPLLGCAGASWIWRREAIVITRFLMNKQHACSDKTLKEESSHDQPCSKAAEDGPHPDRGHPRLCHATGQLEAAVWPRNSKGAV